MNSTRAPPGKRRWPPPTTASGNLLCVVDMNGLQADGPTTGVLRTEPVVDKWAAFGWRTVRVNGNDITALVDAFDSVPADDDRPAVVICDTRIGSGVPFLETREKAHFMRIDENEWDLARQALRAANPAGATDHDHRQGTPLTMTTTAATDQGQAGPQDVRDDRQHRRGRAAHRVRPVRARPGPSWPPQNPADRRAFRRPGEVHRHAHLPARITRNGSSRSAWPSS